MTSDAAWQELSFADEIHKSAWDGFATRFHFTPGMDPETWPAIREPVPSVTFDLAAATGGPGPGLAAVQDAINALGLLAMVRAITDEQRMVVLDWQHPSYLFSPHRQALTFDKEWPVEVYPDGDYFIFLTQDLSSGTFGHPWEQTLCVFGDLFVDVLVPMLSWVPVKRSNLAPGR